MQRITKSLPWPSLCHVHYHSDKHDKTELFFNCEVHWYFVVLSNYLGKAEVPPG